VAALKTADAFAKHLQTTGIALAFDRELAPAGASPLGAPLEAGGVRVGNRFAILPMEGWDGTTDGRPSDLTRRRWRHFGQSGAKLIWGGEAVAVRQEGRANPNQLLLTGATASEIGALREELVASHVEHFGETATRDLFVGLQLTHSGRFARWRAQDRSDPIVAYAHPLLDRKFPGGVRVITDDELDRLVEEFIEAARLARELGFQFVDVKHCHGYLGHELLSARTRPGKYGGSLENRTRFLREVVAGIRANVPGLDIGVRLSAFDSVPYVPGPDRTGVPQMPASDYTYAFGRLNDDDLDETLEESRELIGVFRQLGIRWLCITAGSPYYCPHVQRPALFPPSDGYEPPEDPLRGVARQINATARIKAAAPDMVIVGSGYSYLQEWLPNVAQPAVAGGGVDVVGLGRMVLSYPELAADVLAGRPLRRKSICRTFSDCTTGPRNALVSGCFPLDPFYVAHPDGAKLKEIKASLTAKTELVASPDRPGAVEDDL
jgi:2,4-dienoyl-CoA reductase-like NADH-dependent reductase (Old Yellow Enzyme family)